MDEQRRKNTVEQHIFREMLSSMGNLNLQNADLKTALKIPLRVGIITGI